jgi:formylglycine-generating enzyme required for sulfatase activity
MRLKRRRASMPPPPAVPAPEGMLWIPGGEFSIGAEHAVFAAARPFHRGGRRLLDCACYMPGGRGKADPETGTNHVGPRCVRLADAL